MKAFRNQDFTISLPILEDDYLLVSRGERRVDRLPVLLRMLKSDYPSRQELIWFKNEFEITRNPDVGGMVRSLELLQKGNSLALVQEEPPGQLLRDLMEGAQLSLETILGIGCELASQVGRLHEKRIIHKNLRPESIMVARAPLRATLMDFRMASFLSREYPESFNAQLHGVDLRYIAPEQTGRVNFPIDYRCDLYALGVILYELIAGSVPFPAADPLTLIYDHIATQPKPLTPHLARLPAPVNDLVLKLLSKNPQKRYQSARGLIVDLEKILSGRKNLEIMSGFIVGRHDVPGELVFPKKLYGRDKEKRCILEIFSRASLGGRELLLIAGYSGIGKTSLVQEIYAPMTRSRGYFAQGKYDQFRKYIPLSAFVSALRSLLRQILAGKDEEIACWRDRLGLACGSHGRLLTDILPELEHLIGMQPSVEGLPPQEAKHRFEKVILRFLRCFCTKDHPLVLFLDDLQWADSASLDLLRAMISESDLSYLMVIGAYRDNEVDLSHPLVQTMGRMRDSGVPMQQIALPALQRSHVVQFLTDMLDPADLDLGPLADLVLQKTDGNPFFLIQFLNNLYKDDLLRFDLSSQRWSWDIAEIRRRDLADNVADLMIESLRRLPLPTQDTLQLASCVGSRFDLQMLSTISERPLRRLFADLLPAIQEGLIQNTAEAEIVGEDLLESELIVLHFRFLHDRVQQAAYALVGNEKARSVHLQIGRRLLASLGPEERGEHIFVIADHLDSGTDLIETPAERIELARINLEAARKARESTAYQAALLYFEAAMERLPADLWETHHSLALDLHRERAEVESLNGSFDKAEALIRLALERARTTLEKAETLFGLIVQYTLQARYPEAIELARKTLALLDIELPERDYEKARDQQMALVDEKMGLRPVESLIDLAPMEDLEKKVAMRILTAMGPPCYRNHQRLWSVIVPLEMNLVLEYGDLPAATYTYTSYGGLLGFVRGNRRDCAAYARLAEALAEKYQSARDLSVAHLMIGASLDHWFRHLRHAEESYRKAYQVGVDSGNLQYSSYALGHQAYCRFFRGMPLSEQAEELKDFLGFSRSRKNQWGADLKLGVLRVLHNLTGETRTPLDFTCCEEPENLYIERCERQGNVQVLCIYHLLKAYALYLHGFIREAGQALERAREKLLAVSPQGLLPSAEFQFISALVTAAGQAPDEASGENHETSLAEIRDQFADWAQNCPENFLHKQLLLDAELAALQGRHFEAAELYDRAAHEAGQHDFLQHQALAWERAARFWLSHDKEEFADIYLKKARYYYALWGACVKVELLEEEFPQLRLEDSRQNIRARSGVETALGNLDLMTVVKASQAISGQFRRRDLFTTLMKIVLESAGAEEVFLVQPMEAGLRVVAGNEKGREILVFSRPEPVENVPGLPLNLIQYVANTCELVVIENSDDLSEDFFQGEEAPLSAVCMPVLSQGALKGILYLKNDAVPGAFSAAHVEILKLLAAQAAVSFDNAFFYSQLEERVEERTRDLACANEKLRTTLNDLERTNSDLKQFTYVASHDLQEPLRMISSYLDLLKERYGDQLDADAQDFIGYSVDGAVRMQALIKGLLAYSRVEQREVVLKPVVLSEVLRNTLDNLRVTIEETGVDITSDKLPQVQGDRVQLAQLFQNLIQNATKFRRVEQPRIHISARNTEAECIISVKDNGIGMDPRFSERIFLLFQRLHKRSAYPGTGIGLAICKKVVERHGGKIWVESEPGQGTEICFSLRPVQKSAGESGL